MIGYEGEAGRPVRDAEERGVHRLVEGGGITQVAGAAPRTGGFSRRGSTRSGPPRIIISNTYSCLRWAIPRRTRRGDCHSPEAIESYREHALAHGHELNGLREIIDRCKTALMCYEANPGCCHRSELAAILEERYGLTNVDLKEINRIVLVLKKMHG